MVELFVLGCTGMVVFLHGTRFLFHALTQNLAVRSLSLDGGTHVKWESKFHSPKQVHQWEEGSVSHMLWTNA
ncbi:unnamed protein product [Lupinus luteus]|uniref:Secreted protein n=1 Tax=Lupinus luteus TaxID=3873 RepID=A0AAV1VVM4_LUPLU